MASASSCVAEDARLQKSCIANLMLTCVNNTFVSNFWEEMTEQQLLCLLGTRREAEGQHDEAARYFEQALAASVPAQGAARNRAKVQPFKALTFRSDCRHCSGFLPLSVHVSVHVSGHTSCLRATHRFSFCLHVCPHTCSWIRALPHELRGCPAEVHPAAPAAPRNCEGGCKLSVRARHLVQILSCSSCCALHDCMVSLVWCLWSCTGGPGAHFCSLPVFGFLFIHCVATHIISQLISTGQNRKQARRSLRIHWQSQCQRHHQQKILKRR